MPSLRERKRLWYLVYSIMPLVLNSRKNLMNFAVSAELERKGRDGKVLSGEMCGFEEDKL